MENRGIDVERDVVVRVSLVGSPVISVLDTSQAVIRGIVSCEIQVVRFGNFAAIPLRLACLLKVEIQPVPGEIALAYNSRSYNLEDSR
ncbi:MAG: hypothetical protein Q7O66_06350 [Dehalococcoidia bacterium]|nr:hypothetical protein [Dehalococcoidia bacterium]